MQASIVTAIGFISEILRRFECKIAIPQDRRDINDTIPVLRPIRLEAGGIPV